jgi:two-component system, chemotaxis family, chemotaxis protein CheY
MNSPPLNILLAEDERSVAFSISFALKCDGHQVEIVNDGEEALAKLMVERGVFDLLITDNNMPRMTGVELVRRLRDASFHGKVLVLSAHLSAENRAAYGALGVVLAGIAYVVLPAVLPSPVVKGGLVGIVCLGLLALAALSLRAGISPRNLQLVSKTNPRHMSALRLSHGNPRSATGSKCRTAVFWLF